MNEKSIVKIAMRATARNQLKKNVTIQDDAIIGVCRYVKTHGGIFRVMRDEFGYDVEVVPFIGF